MNKTNLIDAVESMQKRLDRLETIVERSSGAGIKRMLNTEEAASFLGMTIDGLRGLTSKKLIPFYKPNGKNIYFDVDELVTWQKKNHFELIGPAMREGSDS